MDAPQAPVIYVPDFTSKELSAASTSLLTVKPAGGSSEQVQTSVASVVAAAAASVGMDAIGMLARM